MKSLILTLIAGTALGLTACGGGSDTSDAGPATGEPAAVEPADAPRDGDQNPGGPPQQEPGDKPASGLTITTRDSQLGKVLFDADERAIYYFDRETGSASECYGECAAAWPPVLTEGDPDAAGDADAKLLGTTERTDGATQVTYAGHPLYYYVSDPPGMVLCHNVVEFGGTWLAVKPGGDPVP